MSQFINNPIHSMDLSNVLLHCTTIKYYIILSYRLYYYLPDIYTACAPSNYILIFKFVWILINVRKIVFFCFFTCVHISLFYSLVYIFISVCFIYITSAGNFIKLLITINPLIAFFPIISDHALNSKHIYNNCIWGVGGISECIN